MSSVVGSVCRWLLVVVEAAASRLNIVLLRLEPSDTHLVPVLELIVLLDNHGDQWYGP